MPVPNENNTAGNAHFYGFECVNLGDGKDPWPAAQLAAIERAPAALCRAHSWSALADHETRLDALESTRWPLAGVTALAAAGGVAVAAWEVIGH